MSEVVGRAGFHATHTKGVGERGAILHEMMRELDPDAIEYWAARNPSIVVKDEVLNEAYVNDGDGGFTRCTDKQEVLDYGTARLGKVSRKIREDVYNEKTKKMQGGTVTTSMIVTHLPKSMCDEIPNFYPRLDDNGKPRFDADGNPLMRSRWVARDRDEARRYFMDVHAFMAGEIVPGGQSATLGFDIQHSESTPHAQFLMDTFAPDPKNPDMLKASASEAWFAHRDVKDAAGKMKTGSAKMKDYHAGLKEHLVDLGYDISADFDETRHMTGYTKADYERVQDDVEGVALDRVKVRTREIEANVKTRKLDALESTLNTKEKALNQQEDALAWATDKARKNADEQAEEIRVKADADAGKLLAESRIYADQVREDAERRARDSDIGKWLAQNDPEALKAYEDSLKPASAPRVPRGLIASQLKTKEGRELLVTRVGGWKSDGSHALDVELRASDPEAKFKRGLHVNVLRPEGKPLVTHAKYSQTQFDAIKAAAGANSIDVDGRMTYAIRGDLVRSVRGGGLALSTQRGMASSQQRVTADWEALQQQSEEIAQARPRVIPGVTSYDEPTVSRGYQYGD